MRKFFIVLSLYLFWGWLIDMGGGLCVARATDILFLVNGVGLPGVLQIGDKDPPYKEKKEEWFIHDLGLKYRKNSEGSAVLILCERMECVVEHNIAVGTFENILLRRYGAPIKEKRLEDGVFYRYQGVGFKIKQDKVRAIYIFPRLKK